jgi:hypothetical protein
MTSRAKRSSAQSLCSRPELELDRKDAVVLDVGDVVVVSLQELLE